MPQKQATPVGEAPENRGRNGIIAALCAYLMWGFLPIYFKAVQQVAALEILSHRVLWAIPFGAMIIALRRQWPEVRRALTHPRTLGLLTLAAIFIAINWLVFVWAVQQSQIFQASLGYYINPLIYVVIGVLFLGETLRRLQVAAVLLAVAGVAVLTFSGGEFPLISLALAVSFTTYGVIRKQTVVGGMPGLFIETIILMPSRWVHPPGRQRCRRRPSRPYQGARCPADTRRSRDGTATALFCPGSPATNAVDARLYAVHYTNDAVCDGAVVRRAADSGARNLLQLHLDCRRLVQLGCLETQPDAGHSFRSADEARCRPGGVRLPAYHQSQTFMENPVLSDERTHGQVVAGIARQTRMPCAAEDGAPAAGNQCEDQDAARANNQHKISIVHNLEWQLDH
ncbi:MAG: EamA family transporter RarD [Woeseiaceae bacterium]|nr:EamA family transporter RarD [Woeseiaceae bacterium]